MGLQIKISNEFAVVVEEARTGRRYCVEFKDDGTQDQNSLSNLYGLLRNRMQAKLSPWTNSCGPGTGSVFQPPSTVDRLGKAIGSIMSQTAMYKETCQGSNDIFHNLAVWLMAR